MPHQEDTSEHACNDTWESKTDCSFTCKLWRRQATCRFTSAADTRVHAPPLSLRFFSRARDLRGKSAQLLRVCCTERVRKLKMHQCLAFEWASHTLPIHARKACKRAACHPLLFITITAWARGNSQDASWLAVWLSGWLDDWMTG
eukprot:353323-Chlamydomonas_euryale.AAC.8